MNISNINRAIAATLVWGDDLPMFIRVCEALEHKDREHAAALRAAVKVAATPPPPPEKPPQLPVVMPAAERPRPTVALPPPKGWIQDGDRLYRVKVRTCSPGTGEVRITYATDQWITA